MKLLIFLISLYAFSASAQFFEEQVGQLHYTDGQVLPDQSFSLHANGIHYYFQPNKISFVLTQEKLSKGSDTATLFSTRRIDLIFKNSQTSVVQGIEPSKHQLHYYTNYGAFHPMVYNRMIYKSVWPNIDVRFMVVNNQLKWDYIIHPGGKVSDIKWSYLGANTTLNEKGVSMEIDNRSLYTYYPEVYQIEFGKKHLVDFQMVREPTEYGFKIDAYDSTKILVIDPWVSYFGGSDIDENYGLDSDIYGNIYTSGYTFSTDLPITTNAIDTAYIGDYDAYVCKFDSTGQLLWSTYYSGLGGDYGQQVKVDANGAVYHFGHTTSDDLYMANPNVFQDSLNGSYDSYILKLNTQGIYIWSTYFGGTGGDLALAGDLSGNRCMLAGFTSSMDMPLLNGHQTSLGGALDAFVAVFDTTGNIAWSSYYGGINTEDVHACAFDEQQNVIICGDSYSSNFPTTLGAFQTNSNGSQECYLVKFNMSGGLQFATLFGGYSNDDVLSVKAIHNKIYMSGFTKSADFPLTSNAAQNSLNSPKDGFLCKFSDLGALEYSSFFGGNGDDEITGIDVTDYRVALRMNTYSNDLGIVGPAFNNNYTQYLDNYIVLMDTALNIGYSSYIGGVGNEFGRGIKIGQLNDLLLTSFSDSPDLSYGTVFQDSLIGNQDAVIIKIDGIEGPFLTIPFQNKIDISLYPNPTSDYVNGRLPTKETYQVLLSDINGRTLFQNSYNETFSIDVSNLPNGHYHLIFKTLKGQVFSELFEVIK